MSVSGKERKRSYKAVELELGVWELEHIVEGLQILSRFEQSTRSHCLGDAVNPILGVGVQSNVAGNAENQHIAELIMIASDLKKNIQCLLVPWLLCLWTLIHAPVQGPSPSIQSALLNTRWSVSCN